MLIALLLIVCLCAGFLGGWLGAKSQINDLISTGAKRQVILSESEVISDIAKQVGPSVVSIDVTSESRQTDFFGFSQPLVEQGAGTGFIISSDGVILTNRHVVPAGVTKVSVTLSNGVKLSDVSVIGRTADSDPLDVAF